MIAETCRDEVKSAKCFGYIIIRDYISTTRYFPQTLLVGEQSRSQSNPIFVLAAHESIVMLSVNLANMRSQTPRTPSVQSTASYYTHHKSCLNHVVNRTIRMQHIHDLVTRNGLAFIVCETLSTDKHQELFLNNSQQLPCCSSNGGNIPLQSS
jgi:hypothetical protein